MMNIGARFKEARRALKLNQTEFSHNINVSQSAISQIEKNMISPSADILFNISEAYKININWLITGQGEIFLDNNQDYNSVLNNQESSNKQIKELQKQVNSLKKNIQNIDAEYNQEKKQNHILNNQIIQLMKDLLECKNQIINLQKKQ